MIRRCDETDGIYCSIYVTQQHFLTNTFEDTLIYTVCENTNLFSQLFLSYPIADDYTASDNSMYEGQYESNASKFFPSNPTLHKAALDTD
jgi:hypothetical protein